jgi:hypothetical protein
VAGGHRPEVTSHGSTFVALPYCARCGKRNPQRMHGLMCLWFGPLVDLEADLGYFYLCPACHDEVIVPELDRIQHRILELHPAAQRHLEHEWEEDPTNEEDPTS